MLGLAACSENDVSVTGVRLNSNTLTLTVGETERLIAAVLPENATNQNVTWSSDNIAVATVDAQGTVRAVSAGTATITVTADGGKTTTATVTVKVPVTGVTLAPTTLSLPVGGKETLIATIAPATATNQNVTWKSSDESVAEVDDDGVVTAIALGTATITATTVDGEHTATSVVAVIIPVTSVQIDRQALWLAIGKSETLDAFVFPRYATNHNVTWRIGNTNIATVNANGNVTAVAVGTTTITVTTQDGGHTDNIEVIVYNPGIGSETDTTDPGIVISGIRWATRNVDAPGTFVGNPEDIGMLYQWNRNIGWFTRPSLVNSDGGTTWDTTEASGTEWENANDPCPPGWRVPTREEMQSLYNAGSVWTTQNNRRGRFFGTTVKSTQQCRIFFLSLHSKKQ